MNQNLSLKQRIHNANGSQMADKLHAIHSYLHAGARSKEEWETIWSKSDDVSWAHVFGRMRGYDQVYFGNVTVYDAQAYENYISLYNIYPEVGGKDARALYNGSLHPITSGVVEVAEDGLSARAAYLTPGIGFNILCSDEKRWGGICWERYGADFIFEDGEWKYFHEHVCKDILCEIDNQNWAVNAYNDLVNPKPVDGDGPAIPHVLPRLADPGPLHFEYSLLQTIQNTVPWPHPYKTMDNDNTYTPFIRPEQDTQG